MKLVKIYYVNDTVETSLNDKEWNGFYDWLFSGKTPHRVFLTDGTNKYLFKQHICSIDVKEVL